MGGLHWRCKCGGHGSADEKRRGWEWFSSGKKDRLGKMGGRTERMRRSRRGGERDS